MKTVIVSTALGQLEGEQQPGLRIFRNVPYAEPLSGLDRIRAPRPVGPWAGVREALRFGEASAQEEVPLMGAGVLGDACLNLNIWTPEPGAAPLPVMVWIHGGGFVSGSSAQPLYEASRLARENGVVVVSLNYRLGILGFGCWSEFPELQADSNVGLRDQILALEWVRDHIASFGGDPGRVTVFGESAGAMSIACLLASPRARGLFHRAILQSGSGDHVLEEGEARRMTALFRDACADGDVAAVLQGPLTGIVRAQRACFRTTVNRGLHHEPFPQYAMTLLPVLGDDILPEHPEQAMAGGMSADIPVIAGTTTNEWNLFYYAPQMMGLAKRDSTPPDDERILHEFERSLPGRGEAMLAAYRAILPGEENADVFCAFESDRMFCIPTLRLLDARSLGGGRSWHYRFDWPCQAMRRLKSCHVMEVPFVFGITGTPTGQFFSGGGEAAEQLSAGVRSLWAGFARGEELVLPEPALRWPAYEPATRQSLRLAASPQVETDAERERRLVWAAHY